MELNYWSFWKLESFDGGRQRWQFNPPSPFNPDNDQQWQSEEGRKFLQDMASAFTFNRAGNPNSSDKVYRESNGIPNLSPSSADVAYNAVLKAINYYSSLQADSGHWPGDYGGPLFLMPGLIMTSYVTKTPFPP